MNVINKIQLNSIDFIKEVFKFGYANYPDLMPKHSNNFLTMNREIKEAYEKLLSLYLLENNYHII